MTKRVMTLDEPVKRRTVVGAALATAIAYGLPDRAAAAQGAATWSVASPEGDLRLTIDASGGRLSWAVTHRDGRVILYPSALALRLADGGALGPAATVLGTSRGSHKGRWTPVAGISRSYDETSNTLTVHCRDPRTGYRFDIVARALATAVAVRYVVTDANGAPSVALAGEDTEYRLDPAATYYAGRDEGEIHVARLFDFAPEPWPPLTPSTDHRPLADYPVTVDLGNGLFALLAESDRPHFPRAMLRRDKAALVTDLMRFPGRTLGPLSVEIPTPEETRFPLAVGQATPWRVVIVTRSPAALVEQAGVVPTLATANMLGPTDWITTGKAFRIMLPYTTDASLRAVDFAAARGMQYVTFDWHWYGDGTDYSDARVPIAALDLQRVIAYARSKAIGVVLYVDRYAAVRDFDALCRLYRSWGVVGIKLGFIWEGRKSDADTLFAMIKTAGDNHLVADVHDNIRPAGLDRTLPNYVALEGVRGNEQFPTARHNVNLAFQRAVAGPTDYTICYAQARSKTTNAHQLALAAIYYDPQTYLYWYDKPETYADRPQPQFDWFDKIPTIWDETRGLAGALGRYVAVARRHGRRWFVGAITNEEARTVTLDLAFLGSGEWTAHIFRDGAPADPIYRSEVVVEQRRVRAGASLDLVLNAAGGQAVRFEPA